MKRIDLDIHVKGENGNPAVRTVAAFTDKRCPGLAIHAAWESNVHEWRVSHVASGLVVASVLTKTDAQAAMLEIGAIQDWTRPLAEVAAHGEPGQMRWLKATIAAIVKRYRGEA